MGKTGALVPLPPTRLGPLLILLLSLLVIHSPHDPPLSAPFDALSRDLEKRGVGEDLAEGVMALFGTVEKDKDWVLMRPEKVVREVGRGLLFALEVRFFFLLLLFASDSLLRRVFSFHKRGMDGSSWMIS